MLMKRCTVEVVVDLPAKGSLSDVSDAVRLKSSSYILMKSFKVTKTEEFDEMLPFEKVRGERKAVRELLLELFKKHGLPLGVYYNMDHSNNSWLYIRVKAAGAKAYLTRHNNKKCSDNWGTWDREKLCCECKNYQSNDSVRVYIENSNLVENYGNKETIRGTISDPEMTQFMEYLNKYFAWCKKPKKEKKS